MPSIILEKKSFDKLKKEGNTNPFHQKDAIVICSFQFAKSKAIFLEKTDWHLVIVDEAHRLRNVYKKSNIIANTIKEALANKRKVLLTATPLQNSLLELFGLVSIIDEYVFGDLKSFKSHFGNNLNAQDYQELRNRLQTVSIRTLRRQVQEYINYTGRKAICEEFYPTQEEQQLYEWVSEYLQRPKLYALPNSQRQLMTLILRKLLASSTFAIHGTLEKLTNKLVSILAKQQTGNLADDLSNDYDTYAETQDEWDTEDVDTLDILLSDEDIENIEKEIQDLRKFTNLASSIKINSKANQLLIALKKAFEQIQHLGANQKALIFTESRRTQDYLLELLEEHGYRDEVIMFNGENKDGKSKLVYKQWLKEHKGTDKITGSPTADQRAAIVDHFREKATIMIATEAAAEGINLQFCSLVVNYDLPWNPQRIEQRIGRCHRYGQAYDVVVVNFLNKENAADVRVYELLAEKFQLFDGVFGASDEVLGIIGNGTDFEKRIASIYQECRTLEEIKAAFDALQEEMKPEISERMSATRSSLLENFDEEVREKLKIDYEKTKEYLNHFEQRLWDITQFYLQEYATFSNEEHVFKLMKNPFKESKINLGNYRLLKTQTDRKKSSIKLSEDTNIYRSGHPLAQNILKNCKLAQTPSIEIIFDYSNTPTRITALEQYIQKSGWLHLEHINIDSFEQEDHLLLACFTEEGEFIEQELAQRFFSLYARESKVVMPDKQTMHTAKQNIEQIKELLLTSNSQQNMQFFDDEMDKLDQWAEDMKIGLEKEIKDLDAEIKLKKMEARKASNLEEKVKIQRITKELEKKRKQKRENLYTAQDDIDQKKETLLEDIEKMLKQKITQKELFTIKWTMI